jgi:hypothetical protein
VCAEVNEQGITLLRSIARNVALMTRMQLLPRFLFGSKSRLRNCFVRKTR